MSLSKFVPKFQYGQKIFISGRGNSGKSILIDHLYNTQFKGKFSYIVLITENKKFNNFPYIHNVFNLSEFVGIYSNWCNIIEKAKNKENTQALFIFDDFVSNDKITSNINNSIKNLAMVGRHYNCTAIFSAQTYILLQPAVRIQMNYIFCFESPNRKSQEVLYEEFAGCFNGKFTEFRNIYNQYTKNYNCLVINNANESFNPKISYYKAPCNNLLKNKFI